MKTLLLNPPKKWKNLYVCREQYGLGTITSNFLPVNIYLSAAYLKDKNRDVNAIDADTQDFSLKAYDVVVVWVSILHSFYQDIDWLQAAKKLAKKTVMILNDPHEGLEMEAMRRFSFIDVAVRNWEREITLDRLLLAWEKDGSIDFPGIIFRNNGKIVDTGLRPPEPDMHHLKSYHKILSEVPLHKYKLAAIIPSRGCPMPHTLCMHRQSGIRKRALKDVILELKSISEKIKRVFIIDPAMLDDQKWAEEFCRQIEKEKIKILWRTDARLKHCLDPVLLKRLKNAGCHSIMFYTPTLDVEIGKKIKAVTIPETLKSAVKNIRKAGMIPIPAFEIGLPWSSHASMSKIMNFARETPLPWLVLRQFRPWKNTPIYAECIRLKLLQRDLGIDDYVDSSYPIIGTRYLTEDEVETWKHKILRANRMNFKYLVRFFIEGKKLKLEHIPRFVKMLVNKKSFQQQKFF